MGAEGGLAELAQGEVLRQREREHQPAEVPVLGDVSDARRGRRLDPLPAMFSPSIDDGARFRGAHAGDRVDQLLLAVSVDAGERDDLPGSHRQRQPGDLLELTVVEHVQVADLEHRLLRLPRGLARPRASRRGRRRGARGSALSRPRAGRCRPSSRAGAR